MKPPRTPASAPKIAAMLLLTFVEGMQPSEAAAVCGVTAEAMRQRLSRARARLWESVIVGAVCVAYFTEIVRYALRFYGVL